MPKKAKKKTKKKDGRGGLRNPPGGRPVGAVGKVKREAARAFRQYGIDPVEYLCQRMADDDTDTDKRDAIALALLPYTIPRLTATEMTVRNELDDMTPDQLIERLDRLTSDIRLIRPDLKVPVLIEGKADRVNGGFSRSEVAD